MELGVPRLLPCGHHGRASTGEAAGGDVHRGCREVEGPRGAGSWNGGQVQEAGFQV